MQLLKVNLFAFIPSALIGFLILGIFGAVFLGAFAVAFVMIWHSVAKDILLKRLNARLLTEASAPTHIHRAFLKDASQMVQLAGLPRLRFHIVETDLPLAFSLGNKAPGSSVIVTSGLFKTLTRAEISAVVAHELGHINAGDRTMTAFWLSLSELMSELLPGRRPRRPGALLSSVTSRVTERALKPECRADAFAAGLCKDAGIVASALNKLERGVRSSHWDVLDRTPTLGRVATVNPMHARVSYESPEYSPMAHRVAELRRLAPPKAA